MAPVDELWLGSDEGDVDVAVEAAVFETVVSDVEADESVAGEVRAAAPARVGIFVFPAPDGSHMSIE